MEDYEKGNCTGLRASDSSDDIRHDRRSRFRKTATAPYELTVFADAPKGSSASDSIAVLRDHVLVGYGDGHLPNHRVQGVPGAAPSCGIKLCAFWLLRTQSHSPSGSGKYGALKCLLPIGSCPSSELQKYKAELLGVCDTQRSTLPIVPSVRRKKECLIGLSGTFTLLDH
jgi:hypothetical protein